MGSRRQVFSLFVATTLLAAPLAASGARVTDSAGISPTEVQNSFALPLHDAVEDAHGVVEEMQITDDDRWDGLELAVPELVEELELVVAGDEDYDEYELALPDATDGLELAQAGSLDPISDRFGNE